jgi:hypothetical protein
MYCVHEGVGSLGVPHRIIRLSSSLLTNYWGSLVITQEGAQQFPLRFAKFFIVNWNQTNSTFVVRCIPYPYYLEHTTFAPLTLPDINP